MRLITHIVHFGPWTYRYVFAVWHEWGSRIVVLLPDLTRIVR